MHSIEERQRVRRDGFQADLQAVPDILTRPTRDVECLRCCGQVIGLLVQEVVGAIPGLDGIAGGDRGPQAIVYAFEIFAEMRLQGRDRVEAEEAFLGIVQQLTQRFGPREGLERIHLLPHRQHEQAVLADRERQLPA